MSKSSRGKFDDITALKSNRGKFDDITALFSRKWVFWQAYGQNWWRHCLPTCFSLIHYGPRGIIPAHYHFFLCVISQLNQGNKRPDKGSEGPQQGTKGETDKKENYK